MELQVPHTRCWVLECLVEVGPGWGLGFADPHSLLPHLKNHLLVGVGRSPSSLKKNSLSNSPGHCQELGRLELHTGC